MTTDNTRMKPLANAERAHPLGKFLRRLPQA